MGALRHRADELPVSAVTADARSLDLGRRFPLAIAPMQVVQLMGGRAGRAALLAAAARHLEPGGRFAVALADPFEELPPQDALLPLPDVREEDEWVLSSQPVAVRVEEQRRGDRPRPPGGVAAGRPDRGAGDDRARPPAPDELEAEAAEHGFAALASAAGRGDRGLRGQLGRGAGARVSTLRVAALYPELMNIYADRGNIAILRARCEWRGLGFELGSASIGDELDPDAHDFFYIGGGQDRDQVAVSKDMASTKRDALHAAADRGAVVLAVCGGYQLLGHSYQLGEEKLPGVGPGRPRDRPRGGPAADRQLRDRVRAGRDRRLREPRRAHLPRGRTRSRWAGC